MDTDANAINAKDGETASTGSITVELENILEYSINTRFQETTWLGELLKARMVLPNSII